MQRRARPGPAQPVRGPVADWAGAPGGRALGPPRRHAPLAVLGHLNGPPRRHRGAAVRHAQHLHGLALRPPLAVPVQHWGVHALPGRVCVQMGVRAGKPGGGSVGRATQGPYTYLVPGRQVLVLVARIPFFPVQEEEINHLLLVLPAAGERRQEGWMGVPGGRCSHPQTPPRPRPGAAPRRTPRTAGPAAACCGPGSSPASACCPGRRGRCPPDWAASGSAPCGGWAAPARARSCLLCG